MGNSGVVNGHDYITAQLQYLGGDASQYTFRALVTVYSYNVNDTSNNMVISGNWTRSGVLNLGGVYNHDVVWYQDISFPRGASAYSVGFTVTWSGVNYWNATLSANASATVDAAAPVGGPPNPPITVENYNITATHASIRQQGGAENGATAQYCEYHLYAGAPAGQPGASHISTIGGDSAIPKVGYDGGQWPVTLTRKSNYWSYGRTKNAFGWSDWNYHNGFTTLPEAPVVGTGYTAGSITRDSAIITNLTVTDTGGQAINNVRVQHNSSATDVGSTVTERGTWGDVTLTGLTAGTVRHYRVAIANGYVWGDYGPWKSFTTLTGVPSSPAAPTFSSITDNSMTATWVAPAANGSTITGYRWELSATSDFGSLIASGTTDAATLSVNRTGLIPGTRYWWRVRANSSTGNSGYGTAQQLTTGVEPLSGLRLYTFIGGVQKQLTLYACIGGVIKPIKIMWVNGTTVQTE